MEWKGGTKHGRFIMNCDGSGLIYRNGDHWEEYISLSDTIGNWYPNTVSFPDANDPLAFKNSTLKLKVGTDHYYRYYRDNDLVYLAGYAHNGYYDNRFIIGSKGGQAYYDMTIKAIRVYETPTT